MHYQDHLEEMEQNMLKWKEQEKMEMVSTTINLPFEDVPNGLMGLFEGRNVGKLVTAIKE